MFLPKLTATVSSPNFLVEVFDRIHIVGCCQLAFLVATFMQGFLPCEGFVAAKQLIH